MRNVPKTLIPKSLSVTTGDETLQQFVTHRCNAPKSNKYELKQKTKQKMAVGSAWRLLQYCQVSDKNILRHLAGRVELHAVISEVLFIHLFHYFSRGTPNNALRNPGWETLA